MLVQIITNWTYCKAWKWLNLACHWAEQPFSWTDNPENVSDTVAIVPGNVLQKHQHTMKAILVTQISSPMHQCEKYCMLVGWVMIRTRVEADYYG
jgi:hypothetical protein